jgi:ubiquitin C-terminal hydrolase
MARKNAAKHASAGAKSGTSSGNSNNQHNENEEGAADLQFENDEIYFKNSDYYEYHLVGVNVHIGSADAGHYFSYINAVRNGDDSKMSYDPENEQHTQNWLKFNDSRISKFK